MAASGARAHRAPSPPPPRERWRWIVWLVVLVAFAAYLGSLTQNRPQTLAYTEFKERVRAGEVSRVTLRGAEATGSLRAPEGEEPPSDSNPAERFVTVLPPIDDAELMPLLEQHGVELRAESQELEWWQQAIIALLPWVLIVGLIWYVARKMRERMRGGDAAPGLFGFGKSKAKRFHCDESQVGFDDVAGLGTAKEDLKEISDYLKDPERYRRLGAKIPKGILLMGPPGTGKTLLAKAVAGEANVPFFSISGSEFIEMFVGVGASRVRDMFEEAKKASPAIIFIDEIDSVGRARGTGVGGGHDEREQTLNQILGEMDGFAPHEAVVVLAATNRPDVLDAALMRPGRFDRKITMDLPDRRARRSILEIHARDVTLDDDVDVQRLAALTVGFSGADLDNLINEAALLAGREKAGSVTMEALLRARDKVVLGSRRELVIGEDERRLIAYHEAGHAIAAHFLPQADRLDKVTIMPRGRALGATEQIPEEERHNLSESYLRDRIGVMLGGRVSERLVFGETTSGSEQDLKQATRLARRMITQWGMSGALGPVVFRRGEEHVFLGKEMARQRDYSDRTAHLIDAEIRELIGGVEDDVAGLLAEHRPTLDALAEALLASETLDRDAIEAVIASQDRARAEAVEA